MTITLSYLWCSIPLYRYTKQFHVACIWNDNCSIQFLLYQMMMMILSYPQCSIHLYRKVSCCCRLYANDVLLIGLMLLGQMKTVLVCSQIWMYCRNGQMTGKWDLMLWNVNISLLVVNRCRSILIIWLVMKLLSKWIV